MLFLSWVIVGRNDRFKIFPRVCTMPIKWKKLELWTYSYVGKNIISKIFPRVYVYIQSIRIFRKWRFLDHILKIYIKKWALSQSTCAVGWGNRRKIDTPWFLQMLLCNWKHSILNKFHPLKQDLYISCFSNYMEL